ncbi:ATP-binding protein [Sandaracinobacteroides saxicola]|nr:ATP-binding protein [Sandaracinobacteroides saxicola]
MELIAIQLDRLRRGRAARHHLLVGLRGVGKTVLLDEMARRAEANQFVTVRLETPENRSLPSMLVPTLRSALLRLDRGQAALTKAKRALSALRNFASAFRLEMGEASFGVVPAEPGVADSGDLDLDLSDLLCLVGEAAQERGAGLALMIDELQYVPENDLGALIAALHRAGQLQLPVALVGAGLPQLYGLFGRAKSYSERLFIFNEIGPLDKASARQALIKPVQQEGVEFRENAVERVIDLTQGYPYFLQQWGAQVWNVAQKSPITRKDVSEADPLARAELDASFFRVRFDRLTPRERQYLRAMADLGDGPQRSGDVAERIERTTSQCGPVRDSLIRKGMIYSSEHGLMDFTVPLFADFMRRAMPDLEID